MPWTSISAISEKHNRKAAPAIRTDEPGRLSGFGKDRKKKKGVFTGEIESNGNAIIQTKKKGTWSIPVSELFEKKIIKG